MNEGNYDEAIILFSELDDYPDSDVYIKNSKYLKAINLLDNKNYTQAYEIFSELNDYEDSENYAIYIEATKAESSSFIDAYNKYISLPESFLDVNERLDFIKTYLVYAGQYKIPQFVNFYEQDSIINIFPRLHNIDFIIDADNNIKVLLNDYRYDLHESDNADYDFMFFAGEYIRGYISKTELFLDYIETDDDVIITSEFDIYYEKYISYNF